MAERTIWGHLAADPTTQAAGKASVTKFRVIENTGGSRDGKWVEHETPTTHYVEAWFDLGESAAAQLHQGDGIIVVGKERAEKWDAADGGTQYGRILRADRFGIMPKSARTDG